MIIHHGDMWQLPGLKVVTTNSTITKDGRLVMGKGAAWQAKMRYFGIDSIAGQQIQHLKPYYFIVLSQFPLGLFQVKHYWADPASVWLIDRSTYHLNSFAEYWRGPIVMNYPGIGAGGLKQEDVEPIVKQLPDNVTLCVKD